jgi:hypothetical protein
MYVVETLWWDICAMKPHSERDDCSVRGLCSSAVRRPVTWYRTLQCAILRYKTRERNIYVNGRILNPMYESILNPVNMYNFSQERVEFLLMNHFSYERIQISSHR